MPPEPGSLAALSLRGHCFGPRQASPEAVQPAELLGLFQAGVLPRLRPLGGEAPGPHFERCLNAAFPPFEHAEANLRRGDEDRALYLCLSTEEGVQLDATAWYDALCARHPALGPTVLRRLSRAAPEVWTAEAALDWIRELWWEGYPSASALIAEHYPQDPEDFEGVSAAQVEDHLGAGMLMALRLEDEALETFAETDPGLRWLLSLIERLEPLTLPEGLWHEGEAVPALVLVTDQRGEGHEARSLILETAAEATHLSRENGDESEARMYPLSDPETLREVSRVVRERHMLLDALVSGLERLPLPPLLMR